MTLAELTYDHASNVREFLMHADGIGIENLIAALANAMNRIATLEKQVEDLERKDVANE